MSGSGAGASRAAAGALRIGRTVGAALTEQRVLETTEARVVAIVGVLMLGLAVAGAFWPRIVAFPLAVVFAWIAVALLTRAYVLARTRRSRGLPITRVTRTEKDTRSRTG